MKFRPEPHKETRHEKLVHQAENSIDFVFSDLDVEPEITAESLDHLTEYIQTLRCTL